MATLPNNSKLVDFPNGFEVIAARSTTETDPEYRIEVGDATTVKTYQAYSGTVSSCTLTLCSFINGVWYEESSTADGDALTGSANETRVWEVEADTVIGFKVSAIAGGGTVSVRAKGIA